MKGLTIKVDRMRELVQQINKLTGKAVFVGVPSDEASREGSADEDRGPVNNAALAYIHENGAPEANIPARPFLASGIEENSTAIESRLKKAADEAMKGKRGNVDSAMEKVGQTAQSGVRRKINSGAFEPLSEATLRARARRGRKGAKEELDRRAKGEAPGTADAKPLIDTGQLRNSINYVVR
ncbi:MAG: hypothetical protein Q8S92_22765 [Hydrogenophaga sp.]|uniref:hypothetical protein n=1 Tax=Hydrogenophaga sp. TaxID=1904254 RepID=UPI002734DD9D|nr:hypothetical protein [Hydrogenophaga sp.]MDP3351818.1 hypothetical protein [Hydrogenophaga sp.]